MSVSSLEVWKVFNSGEKILSDIGKLYPNQSKNVNVKRFILRNQFFCENVPFKNLNGGGYGDEEDQEGSLFLKSRPYAGSPASLNNEVICQILLLSKQTSTRETKARKL